MGWKDRIDTVAPLFGLDSFFVRNSAKTARALAAGQEVIVAGHVVGDVAYAGDSDWWLVLQRRDGTPRVGSMPELLGKHLLVELPVERWVVGDVRVPGPSDPPLPQDWMLIGFEDSRPDAGSSTRAAIACHRDDVWTVLAVIDPDSPSARR